MRFQRRRHVLGFFSPLLLLACGSDPSDSKVTSDSNTTRPTFEGSYDLSFQSVHSSDTTSANNQSPTLQTKASLDIHKVPGAESPAYEAFVSEPWGLVAKYSITETEHALILKAGDSQFGASSELVGDPGCYYVRIDEKWSTLTLPRNTDGTLTGEVHGTGTQAKQCSDYVTAPTPLEGTGMLLADKTNPEIRVEMLSSFGAGAPLLPWSPIVIQTSEPVPSADLRQAASLKNTTSGDAVPLQWKDNGTTSDTIVRASAVIDWPDWNAAVANSWRLEVDGSRVHDGAGNAATTLSNAISFLPLSTVDEIHFDGDGLDVTPWGTVEHLVKNGKVVDPIALPCESGGCLRLGPTNDFGTCREPFGFQAGAALRRDNTATQVEIRFRAFSDVKKDSMTALRLVTSSPENPDGKSVDVNVDHLTQLSSPVDSLEYGSDWTTATVPIPQGGSSGPIAIAVVFADGCERAGSTPSDRRAANVEVLVQSVKFK